MVGNTREKDGRGLRLLTTPFLAGAAWAFFLMGGLRALRPLLGAAAADPARLAVLGALLIGAAAGALAGVTILRRRGRGIRAAIRFVPAGIALLLPLLPLLDGLLPAEIAIPLLAAAAGVCLGAAVAETLADPGREVAGLALALAGGGAGAFLAGWYFLPASGILGVSLVSFALFLVAGGALILPGSGMEMKPGGKERVGSGWSVAIALLLTAAAGGIVMSGWTRMVDLAIGSTERNLALTTAWFLLGLGGGAASSGLRRRVRIEYWTIGCAILFVSFLVALLLLFPRVPFWYVHLAGGGLFSPAAILRGAALLSAIIVLPGAVFLGAAAGALLGDSASRGSAGIGRGTIALATGAALGAAAFPGLLARAGVSGVISGAAALLLLGAILFLLFTGGRRVHRRLIGAVPLVLLLVIVTANPPRWWPGLASTGMFRLASLQEGKGWDEYRMAHSMLPSFYRDGPAASMLVIGAPGVREIRRDGWIDGSDGGLRPVEILLARLPLLFRPEAEKLVVLGAGTGATSGVLLRAGAGEVLLVEPEPAALRAIRYFDRINGEPWKNDRFRTRVEDPRRFLRRSGPFDVIVCGDASPVNRKRAHLRTEEFFRLAASRLREGGVVACPIPLGGFREDHLRSLLLSFRAAFPEVLVFRAGDRARLILLGSDRPLSLSAAEALERWEDADLAADFAYARVQNLEGLVAVARMDGEIIDRYAGGAVPNRDSGGFAEYGAEWWLRELENPDLDAILLGLEEEADGFLDYESLPEEELGELHFRIARAFRGAGYGPAGLVHAEKGWRHLRVPETAEMFAHFLRTEADDLESAIRVARLGLALDPDNEILGRRLAEDLFSARRFDECEDFLTGLIARGGYRPPWNYLIRGKARLAQGRHDEGLEDLLEAKEIDRLQDRQGIINFYIAMALKNLGRLEDSQNYLARTLKSNPRHRLARYEFGENKLLLGEIERGEFEQEYLIPNNRARAESLFVRSEKNLYEPGHAEEVEKGLITVINSTPNHFGAYFRLAEFYGRRGETDLERKALERAGTQFARRQEILELTERYLRRTGGEEKVRAYRDLLRKGNSPPPAGEEEGKSPS